MTAKPLPAVEVEERTNLPRYQEGRYEEDEGDPDNERNDKYEDPTIHFGDEMSTKNKNICRIISCQLRGYAKTTHTEMDKAKNKQLQDLVQHTGADILLTQEDNTNWKKMMTEDRMKERMRKWARDIRVSSAYNMDPDEEDGTHLQGGASACTFDDSTSRIIEIGVDETRMGRWAWIRHGGKME